MTKSTVGGAISRPGCSPRVPIMPVRYAIVPRVGDSAHFVYQDAGFNLEQDFAPLMHSAYTLRALRPGYVYVFMKGSERQRLVIHEYNGEGLYKELRYTGLENYGQRKNYQSGKSLGWIWADTDPQSASEVWISYSPHLWTTAMTQRITTSAALRKRHMRAIDTAELVNGDPEHSRQPHVLPASALGEWVEDFKLEHQRIDLNWSSSHSQLYFATFQSMARHYPRAQPRIPAVVVLNDAEGITLDLGLSVSAYQHALRDLRATEPEQPVRPHQPLPREKPDPTPGCFRLNTERICRASREFHSQNLVALLLEKTLESFYTGDLQQLDQQVQTQAAELEQQTGQPQSAALLRYAHLTDEKHSELGARLGQRIDLEKYKAFITVRDQLEKGFRTVQAIMIRAGNDHDTWLATAETAHIDNPHGLAAALASYDRDQFDSASALETSLALIIDSMGQVMPGTEYSDARFKRLQQWLDHQGSPLYMALAPFNPFKDKADAVGTLLGATDAVIEALAPRFPALANVTDLTSQAVHTVVLHRLKGKTRWSASRTLRQIVQAAAQEANAEKALGLLGARYKITDELARQNPFTQDIDKFLKAKMGHIEEIRQVRITGSRKVTLQSTTTLQVKATAKAVARTVVSAGLNPAMLWFNLVNLKVAYANVQNDPQPEYVAGFASAIFAVIGATGAVLVSARSAQMLTLAHMRNIVPGSAFAASTVRFLSSHLFARGVGYPTIIFGIGSDFLKAYRQYHNGDSTSSALSVGGGIFTAAGGFLILEGSLSIAGVSTFIPVIGWAAAAVVILGGVILASGVYLHAQASKRLHTPMELWAARSVFGSRLNDGEERDTLYRPHEEKLKGFDSLADELQSWHATYYTPHQLSGEAAEKLGIKGIDTRWHNEAMWSAPDGETIIQSHSPQTSNTAEFSILLKSFILGQSQWLATIEAVSPEDQVIARLETEAVCYLTPAGLILHFTIDAKAHKRLSLTVTYTPNDGLHNTAAAKMRFILEHR